MQLHYAAPRFLRALFSFAAAAAGLLGAPSAHAMRPFDGTDAAVAEQGMFELEMGGGYLRQTGGRVRTLPAAVATFGLGYDTELALEGRLQSEIDHTGTPYRTGLNDTQLTVKHVLRNGSMQDGAGVSVALECAALLPNYHGESGGGASCAGLASQRWRGGAVHLNVGVQRDRSHQPGQFYSVILDGPEDWTVRPVLELTHEHNGDEPRAHGTLLGLVWKAGEELAFDAAVRHVHSDGARLTELRFGLTWGFRMGH
jgi:hypothetical protein